MSDRGSAGPTAMATLILIGSLLAGLSWILSAGGGYIRKANSHHKTLTELEAIAAQAIDILEADTSPGADCIFDPIFNLKATLPLGVSLTIRDVSSSINLNLIRPKLLEETKLKMILADGVTPEALRQYRLDKGLSTERMHYKGIVDSSHNNLTTLYGWANINTTDEFSLRMLHMERFGSLSRAQGFHSRIQQLLATGQVVRGNDLIDFLGIETNKLWPIINAAPSYNVNFIDAFILNEILAYPPYEIEDPETKANSILMFRSSGEIGPMQLASILAVTESHPLLQYLGTTTWFWELSIKKLGIELQTIIALLPSKTQPIEKKKYIVIERRLVI